MMKVTPQLGNSIKKLFLSDIRMYMYTHIACRKHYLSVVYFCALCTSVILQSSVHTSDGWRYAFNYRWIKVYNRYLLRMNMSFCSHTRVFGVVSCVNLHSTVYQNTITWKTVNFMN